MRVKYLLACVILSTSVLIGGCGEEAPPATESDPSKTEDRETTVTPGSSESKQSPPTSLPSRDSVTKRVFGWPGPSTITTIVREMTNTGETAELRLTTGPLESLRGEYRKPRYYWGYGGEDCPDPAETPFVQRLAIIFNGHVVDIPPRAYVDLIDLRISSPLFWNDADALYLQLSGSDAGESYYVWYTIKNYKLIKREIWPGEFPEYDPEVLTFE